MIEGEDGVRDPGMGRGDHRSPPPAPRARGPCAADTPAGRPAAAPVPAPASVPASVAPSTTAAGAAAAGGGPMGLLCGRTSSSLLISDLSKVCVLNFPPAEHSFANFYLG